MQGQRLSFLHPSCEVSGQFSRPCPVAEVIEGPLAPAFPNEMANGGSVRRLTMAAAISSVVSATSTCVPAWSGSPSMPLEVVTMGLPAASASAI